MAIVYVNASSLSFLLTRNTLYRHEASGPRRAARFQLAPPGGLVHQRPSRAFGESNTCRQCLPWWLYSL